MMPEFQEVLYYLGIDEVDAMITANVNRSMATAAKRLEGAIGKDVETYLPGDHRITELALIYTRESYDAASLTDKERAALKHLRDDLEPQLKLELWAAKGKAGVI